MADIQSMGNRYFVFWDDNFFGDADYAVRLMTALQRLRRRWAAQVSIDRCADERLLRLARESGCVYLFIGLESFSEEGLASVNKGFNQVARYRKPSGSSTNTAFACRRVSYLASTPTTGVFADTLRPANPWGLTVLP